MQNPADAAPAYFRNPVIRADVPDPDIIRVEDRYYMLSTSMYFTPGCPVMRSYDLVNWRIIGYVYDILEDDDSMNLANGKDAYGKGSWAPSLRYRDGTYYAVFAANNTGKTYIYKTEDIENGPWRKASLDGIYHDPSLLFDDDGRAYLIYGSGRIRIDELNADATALREGGLSKILFDSADLAGASPTVPAEGAHAYRIGGRYYVFLIVWPGGGRRTELCYRSDNIDGVYEGKIVYDNTSGSGSAGVAQGGLVQTEAGGWYAMLFQDHGPVGRLPVLLPVVWEEDWPVFDPEGIASYVLPLPLPARESQLIAASDSFDDASALSLVWQWNHNPVNTLWSLAARPGWLRLTNGVTVSGLDRARNTLTQRSCGSVCDGEVLLDGSGMQDGDTAGLAALQYDYGFVGLRIVDGERFAVMVSRVFGEETLEDCVPLDDARLRLRVSFDFRTNKARFFYRTDNSAWSEIGTPLKMTYSLKHFTGYRFALFNYAVQKAGGFADFSDFRLETD